MELTYACFPFGAFKGAACVIAFGGLSVDGFNVLVLLIIGTSSMSISGCLGIEGFEIIALLIVGCRLFLMVLETVGIGIIRVAVAVSYLSV
jgi:hypothetical protein